MFEANLMGRIVSSKSTDGYNKEATGTVVAITECDDGRLYVYFADNTGFVHRADLWTLTIVRG